VSAGECNAHDSLLDVLGALDNYYIFTTRRTVSATARVSVMLRNMKPKLPYYEVFMEGA
jgi:hypothetical protein